MKLYSWIENEKGNVKRQGGNKAIGINLEYEESGQDWRCNPPEHSLYIRFKLDINGKPIIFINGNKNFTLVDNR